MTLQNRVDPWGALHAHASRAATRMGNRGILHDAENKILRPWRHQHWVCCLMSFKGIQRKPFSQGKYSELFFLDEATAFAAGHRPCSYCQRERSALFYAAWSKANTDSAREQANITFPEIDKILHKERAIRGSGKVTYQARLDALPLGTMVELEGNAYLLWTKGLRAWSFDGYDQHQHSTGETLVRVLTPRSIVGAFAAGFLPLVHPTAA